MADFRYFCPDVIDGRCPGFVHGCLPGYLAHRAVFLTAGKGFFTLYFNIF